MASLNMKQQFLKDMQRLEALTQEPIKYTEFVSKLFHYCTQNNLSQPAYSTEIELGLFMCSGSVSDYPDMVISSGALSKTQAKENVATELLQRLKVLLRT